MKHFIEVNLKIKFRDLEPQDNGLYKLAASYYHQTNA